MKSAPPIFAKARGKIVPSAIMPHVRPPVSMSALSSTCGLSMFTNGPRNTPVGTTNGTPA